MATRRLVLRAGPRAADRLRAEGFHPDLFGTLVGASGGPKWLVLRHVDDLLVDRLILPRSTPLDTLGSSIGSFRHACFAQHDPHGALERFAQGYVHQAYDGPGSPSMEAISAESDRILTTLLGDAGAAEIVSHPLLRSHFVAARLRRDRGHDRGLAFKLQLGRAAARNLISRGRIGASFERLVFHAPGGTGTSADSSIRFVDLVTRTVPLEPANVRPALLASGSIPLVMAGVRDTPGVPGTLFDGGIIDYHFDFRFRRRPGLVLFPHFFDRITPGWFDKPLRWRRPRLEDLDDVLMIAPSDAFVSALPGGRVPDRNDFLRLGTAERIRRWKDVVDRCRVLADELHELIETQRLAEAVLPFEA